MKIIYTIEGQAYTLTYHQDGTWSGGHPGYAESLNLAFVHVVGRYEYYPTPWHRVNHVAQVLNGTLDTMEPDFETGEPKGKVF